MCIDMKAHFLSGLLLLLATATTPLAAQSSTTNSANSSTSTSSSTTSSSSNSDSSAPILSSAELQQLVGPIALYSDPLLALILPASTYPNEITQADDYLNNGGSQAGIAYQNWDKSVQGLAHYPDVLHMMASNKDWTNQLGAAVLAQQSDVMAAVQAMRAKAKNLGNLVSTPQQSVVTENGAIQIAPASPQTVYVPTYNPAVVYTQPVVIGAAPLITFGLGFGLGAWADFGFNWGWGWGGGGICSGGFYNSSFGWSSSYHSWSSSHYSWHRDWNRGGRPHPSYHPGHGGRMPGWHPHDHGTEPFIPGQTWHPNNQHFIPGETWHHPTDPHVPSERFHPNQHGGEHPNDQHNIPGETWHHPTDPNVPSERFHPNQHNDEHPDRDRDPGYDRDRQRREEEPHRHNSKENHDRHEHRAHHEPHHEHHGGGHHGGGHRR